MVERQNGDGPQVPRLLNPSEIPGINPELVDLLDSGGVLFYAKERVVNIPILPNPDSAVFSELSVPREIVEETLIRYLDEKLAMQDKFEGNENERRAWEMECLRKNDQLFEQEYMIRNQFRATNIMPPYISLFYLSRSSQDDNVKFELEDIYENLSKQIYRYDVMSIGEKLSFVQLLNDSIVKALAVSFADKVPYREILVT